MDILTIFKEVKKRGYILEGTKRKGFKHILTNIRTGKKKFLKEYEDILEFLQNN